MVCACAPRFGLRKPKINTLTCSQENKDLYEGIHINHYLDFSDIQSNRASLGTQEAYQKTRLTSFEVYA